MYAQENSLSHLRTEAALYFCLVILALTLEIYFLVVASNCLKSNMFLERTMLREGKLLYSEEGNPICPHFCLKLTN